MTTKSKLILGVAVSLAFIVVAVAGFRLGQQNTVPATAQSVAQTQPEVQLAPRSADPPQVRTTPNGFSLLSPAEVNTLRTQPNVLVIDVRGDFVWASEHVPGAISFPEDQAEQRYDELPRDKLIVAY
ncbi:MAG: rhodanese-like domain-containing protein [Anaerolineae bacterium]